MKNKQSTSEEIKEAFEKEDLKGFMKDCAPIGNSIKKGQLYEGYQLGYTTAMNKAKDEFEEYEDSLEEGREEQKRLFARIKELEDLNKELGKQFREQIVELSVKEREIIDQTAKNDKAYSSLCDELDTAKQQKISIVDYIVFCQQGRMPNSMILLNVTRQLETKG